MAKTLFELVCEPFCVDEKIYIGVFIANKYNVIETLVCTALFNVNVLIKRQKNGEEYIIKKRSTYSNFQEYLIAKKGDN